MPFPTIDDAMTRVYDRTREEATEKAKPQKIMFLMRGPPGSGKSTFAANYMTKMDTQRLKTKLQMKMKVYE